ncbi:MAG: DUF1499 domain-containing protein [Chloroflexi bacterium]|nr:DUF1499 domain-containing protein [Chloroflexota bacterium]
MTRELPPCRFWPNCVSSRSDAAARQRIEPFALSGDPVAAFARLKALVKELPRTEIVTSSEDYLHAVCRTPRNFADDVEFRLHPEEGVIHVRSASRFGIGDIGVNRERVEAIRRRLQAT